MLDNLDYIDWFNYEGTIPDEHCYITNIFYNKLEKEIIIAKDDLESTTFVNWEGSDYKYVSLNELKNYKNISEEELKYLINSKCLFGRKFNIECNLLNIEYIKMII